MYIDDILLIAQSPKLLKQHTLSTLNLLEALGYLVNYPKSQLIPTQSTTFLGFVVDCQTGELSLPSSKVKSIQKEAQHLLTQPLITPHQLAQFIGKLPAVILAVHPAPLHMHWSRSQIVVVSPASFCRSSLASIESTKLCPPLPSVIGPPAGRSLPMQVPCV